MLNYKEKKIATLFAIMFEDKLKLVSFERRLKSIFNKLIKIKIKLNDNENKIFNNEVFKTIIWL